LNNNWIKRQHHNLTSLISISARGGPIQIISDIIISVEGLYKVKVQYFKIIMTEWCEINDALQVAWFYFSNSVVNLQS